MLIKCMFAVLFAMSFFVEGDPTAVMAIAPLILAALIGAGAGGLKSAAIDAPREKRQRKLAATTTRWSPWTGMKPGKIQEADPFGSMLSGAAMGAMFGKTFGAGAGAGGTAPIVGGAGQQVQAMKQGVLNQGAGNPLAPTDIEQMEIGGWNQQSPWAKMGTRYA